MGKMQPGQAIRELSLAKSLGVSQSTVREALSQLEHSGLVVREPNRATMVTRFGGREVRDRLKIRLILEELAAAEACERATDDELFQLTRFAEDITRAVASNSFFEVVEADLGFHRHIWRISQNMVLRQSLDTLTTPLFAYVGILYRMAPTAAQNMQPHESIIEALGTRDAEAARRAIREHIEGSYGTILNATDGALDEDQALPSMLNVRR